MRCRAKQSELNNMVTLAIPDCQRALFARFAAYLRRNIIIIFSARVDVERQPILAGRVLAFSGRAGVPDYTLKFLSSSSSPSPPLKSPLVSHHVRLSRPANHPRRRHHDLKF